jgi:hypothetical protein
MSRRDLNDAPQGSATKWLLGGAAPIAIAAFGTWVLLSGRIVIYSHGHRVEFEGLEASAWGVLILAAAAFMHCHFLWGNSNRLAPYADLGKLAALVGVVVSAGYLALSVFAF